MEILFSPPFYLLMSHFPPQNKMERKKEKYTHKDMSDLMANLLFLQNFKTDIYLFG